MKVNFPENLKQLRKFKGISQEELANKLGLSKGAISQYEAGRAYPGVDSLIKLCIIFDVTLDELILDPGSYNSKPKAPSPEDTLESIKQYPKDKPMTPAGLIGHFVTIEAQKEIEYLNKTVNRQEREINTMRSYTARLEKELEKCEDSLKPEQSNIPQTG